MTAPRWVVERLVAAGCVAAEEEADELAASAPNAATLEAWTERRARGEPLAWVIGWTEFCGQRVFVDAGVYVPRRQSDELVRRAAALVPTGGAVADLCTGSGAIAACVRALSRPAAAIVVGVDCDERAVRCARRNGVPAVLGDVGGGLRSGAFDVVTAVAPYVPRDSITLLPRDAWEHEPWLALDGGSDGLDVVRRVVDDAARLLRPGGALVIEVGGEQDQWLASDLSAAGFHGVEPWLDDDGDLRGVIARSR